MHSIGGAVIGAADATGNSTQIISQRLPAVPVGFIAME